MTKRFPATLFSLGIVVAFLFAGPLLLARAAITALGSIDPSDPSTWTSSTEGYVGKSSAGTLTIDSGSDLLAFQCFVGDQYSEGFSLVTVSGAGSTLSVSDAFVANYGNGLLKITNGGAVNVDNVGLIGFATGSGTVTVEGAGSRWTGLGNNPFIAGINLGNGSGSIASGTLNISGGGLVTSTSVLVCDLSLLAIDVGCGSSLSVGSGGIGNYGKVRFLAGAGVAAGSTWSPIAAGTWGGTGTYQAVGGTLDTGSHQFTVSQVVGGTSGTAVEMDLKTVQRVRVDDGSTGWSLGASFLKNDATTPLSLRATAISDGPLSSLGGLLGPGQSVLGGWLFATDSGYTLGDPAYLSFGVGAGRSTDGLEVWRYNGSTWADFSASDLTYDGNWARFTATDLGGFAVTTVAVPEPGVLVLLGVGVVGVLGYVWRRRV